MHILLLRSHNPFFESSASGNRFAGIISGLLKYNVRVTLVVTGGYSNFAEYKAKGRNFVDSKFFVHYTTITFNCNIWFRRMNKFLIGKVLRKINQYRIKNYFKQDYDYIWLTNNIDILSAFNRYSKLIKNNTIIELNEFNDIYKSEGATDNKLQLKYAIATEKTFLQCISKINYFAVMTNTLIGYYRTMAKPEAKFLHLPMTVDLSRFQNINDTNKYKKPYIAFTGTYTNVKDGVDILIKSFAKICSKYLDYHLYLAGFYHYDVLKQKELISQLGLNDRVTYLGMLDKEQIPEFVCNSDLLVLSRPDSHQARGGFPTKLGEYLATGNPVCVTKVGEISDYLEDNVSAFMAAPGDVDSFADAMDRALFDKEKARRVGLNGRKVAEENFSIDVQAKRLVQFLKDNQNTDY